MRKKVLHDVRPFKFSEDKILGAVGLDATGNISDRRKLFNAVGNYNSLINPLCVRTKRVLCDGKIEVPVGIEVLNPEGK